MIRKILVGFLLLTIVILSSCNNEPPLLQKKIEFGVQGWNRFKYLEVTPEITDISVPYTFTLKLKFTEEYEHNFFKIQLSKENNEESYIKIFSIPVKDQQGIFIEKAKDGVYTVTAILSNQIYFSSPGKYLITIEQLMPKFDTKGIKSVEFIIQKGTK